ncbi:hypothetical protein XELAEV_18029209mg [Xenopus laevis]|uniref:Uncharacterized protein n=1 Tax=Xenopus laevis TaxID=8355 RepID=A0A974CRQ2_XENLA|nr:hypothetical protein XELAEV_18029209mg [Xenopus laevis]
MKAKIHFAKGACTLQQFRQKHALQSITSDSCRAAGKESVIFSSIRILKATLKQFVIQNTHYSNQMYV